MATTLEAPSYSNIFAAVPQVVEAFDSLPLQEKLELLWALYPHLTGLVASTTPNRVEKQFFACGLSVEVINLSFSEQLQFLTTLIEKIDTPLTHTYRLLSSNNKLAFWYRLAQYLEAGKLIPAPENVALSVRADAIFHKIIALDKNQQIAALRLIVGRMGLDPFSI